MLKIEIKTGGSVYRDEETGGLDSTSYELRRNLREIESRLKRGYTSGVIMDLNGNKTGKWSLEEY